MRYSASTAITTTATIRAVVAMIAAERVPGSGASSAAAGCAVSLIAALFDAAHTSPPTAVVARRLRRSHGLPLDFRAVESLDTRIDGPILVKPTVHGDERGFFSETYRRNVFR